MRGENKGLGLIEGNVQKLSCEYSNSMEPIKIPNIGWRKVTCFDPENSIIFDQKTNNKEYYHVHSFHFILGIENILLALHNLEIQKL